MVGPVVRNDASAEFFDGTARGQFLIKRCGPARHASRPQAKLCDVCGSQDLIYEPASGGARLVSWAIVPARRGGRDSAAPAVPIIAELDEGPWWWSMIVDTDPASLEAGMPLRVRYDRAETGEAVPVFVVDQEGP